MIYPLCRVFISVSARGKGSFELNDDDEEEDEDDGILLSSFEIVF